MSEPTPKIKLQLSLEQANLLNVLGLMVRVEFPLSLADRLVGLRQDIQKIVNDAVALARATEAMWAEGWWEGEIPDSLIGPDWLEAEVRAFFGEDGKILYQIDKNDWTIQLKTDEVLSPGDAYKRTLKEGSTV